MLTVSYTPASLVQTEYQIRPKMPATVLQKHTAVHRFIVSKEVCDDPLGQLLLIQHLLFSKIKHRAINQSPRVDEYVISLMSRLLSTKVCSAKVSELVRKTILCFPRKQWMSRSISYLQSSVPSSQRRLPIPDRLQRLSYPDKTGGFSTSASQINPRN